MNRTQSIALATALALSPLSLLPAAAMHHAPLTMQADSCTVTDAYAREVGDDNCDGMIMEDESGWDCATMGNLICGPGQSSPNADITYCPADDTWSATWHPCATLTLATGPNAWDAGAYVGGWN